MIKWKSLAHWTPDAAPNPQKSYNSLFKIPKENRVLEFSKMLYIIMVPRLQKRVKYKIINPSNYDLKGKKYAGLRDKEKRQLPNYITAKRKDREEPHNHEHNTVQTY